MIVFDIETTGLLPEKHSILSIGAIDANNLRNHFYMECRARKGAEIAKDALDINGFSYAEVRDRRKPSEAEMVREWIRWLRKSPNSRLAGQNIILFDIPFLKHAARVGGIEFRPKPGRIIDMKDICLERYKYSTSRFKDVPELIDTHSRHIYEFVGMPLEPNPHNALIGAVYEAEALNRLLYGSCLIKGFSALGFKVDFSKNPVPRYLDGKFRRPKKRAA